MRVKRATGVMVAAFMFAGFAVTSCSHAAILSASATISASGGAVHSTDGHLTVTIPAGAVSTDTVVTVSPLASSVQPAVLRNIDQVGNAYRITPENLTFAKPVTVTMVEPESTSQAVIPEMFRLAAGATQPQLTEDEKTDVNLASKTVTVTGTTTHFSTYVLSGVASISLIPSSVTAQVGQSWTSNVTITNMVSKHGGLFFSSMLGVDDRAIFALEPIVPASVTYKAEWTVPNSPGTGVVDPAPSYTCGAAGRGSFGMSMEIVTSSTTHQLGLGDRTTVEGTADCTQATTTSTSSSTTTSTTVPPAPKVAGIHADFNQGLFTSSYDIAATPSDGLSYAWSVTMQSDPGCGTGFKASPFHGNQAAWYHADTSKGGPCDHQFEGANGHPGTVQVVVSNQNWTCTATYQGTNTGDGDPPNCTAR